MIITFHFLKLIRGLVHDFVHDWGPLVCTAGIGPKLVVQCCLLLPLIPAGY